jgi:hypothetical protein
MDEQTVLTELRTRLKAARDKTKEVYNEEWHKAMDLPTLAQYTARIEEISEPYNLIDRAYRKVQKPSMSDIPKYGCHMTFPAFKATCINGGFIDYDGSGNYATVDKQSNISIFPSDIMSNSFREDFTHVCWYNR